MPRIFLFVLFLLTILHHGHAQQLSGNEWIDYKKGYLKIEISTDGIYRISYDELKSAGLLSLKNLKMVHHGIEVKIKSFLESDGELKPGGYIEFYAEKNKGDLDSLVYRPMSKRTNPYQSLFSDVSAYFLVNSDNQVSRIESVKTLDFSGDVIFQEELVLAPNTQYSFNNNIGLLPVLMQSYYEPGEGWSGDFVSADTSAHYKLNLPDFDNSTFLEPRLTLSLNGRSRVFHNLSLDINGKTFDDNIEIEPFGFTNRTYFLSKPINNTLVFTFKSLNKNEYDWYSPNYFKISYPRKIVDGFVNRKLTLYGSSSKVFPLKLKDKSNLVYDITSMYQPKEIQISSLSCAFLNTSGLKHANIFVSDKPLKPSVMSILKFQDHPIDTEYLIITASTLKSSATEFANYRSSEKGGGYKTEVVFVDDIYNQYFYGEKNPEALKRYINSKLASAKRKFVLFLGHPVTFPDVLKNSNEIVPSYGYPGSDVLFSNGLFGKNSDVQAVATGRLNVTKNDEVLAYLSKVKEFENIGSAEWRKKLLHLSGGENAFEMTLLKGLLNDVEPIATQNLFSAEINTKNKKSDNEIEEIDLSKEINSGASLLTFVGHGSPTIIDLNFGFCSDPKRNISNKGKYPLMFFNGCGVGNIFYRYNTLSSDWLLTPNKGSIAVLSNSYWSYYYPTKVFLEEMYKTLFSDKNATQLTLGEVHQKINEALSTKKTDEYVLAEMHQVVLQGDPALKIFPTEKPDFLVKENGLFLQSRDQVSLMNAKDSLNLGLLLQNFGLYENGQKVTGNVTLTYENGSFKNIPFKFESFGFRDTVFVAVPKDTKIRKIEAILDPNQLILEYNEENNKQSLMIESEQKWSQILQTSLYPDGIIPDNINPVFDMTFDGVNIENGGFVASNVAIVGVLRDERRLAASNPNLVKLYLKKCESCSFELLDSDKYSIVSQAENVLKIEIKNQVFTSGKYTVLVQAQDEAGNSIGNPYQKSFEVLGDISEGKMTVFPNPSESFIQAKIEVLDIKNPKNVRVSVFDASGKVLFEQELNGKVGVNSIYIPAKELFGAGIYILKSRVEHENGEIEQHQSKIVVR
jgi:Peptidase family C25